MQANHTADLRSTRSQRDPDAPVGWGAAIVDEHGNETPITESMIARACDELARHWTFPVGGRARSALAG